MAALSRILSAYSPLHATQNQSSPQRQRNMGQHCLFSLFVWHLALVLCRQTAVTEPLLFASAVRAVNFANKTTGMGFCPGLKKEANTKNGKHAVRHMTT